MEIPEIANPLYDDLIRLCTYLVKNDNFDNIEDFWQQCDINKIDVDNKSSNFKSEGYIAGLINGVLLSLNNNKKNLFHTDYTQTRKCYLCNPIGTDTELVNRAIVPFEFDELNLNLSKGNLLQMRYEPVSLLCYDCSLKNTN